MLTREEQLQHSLRSLLCISDQLNSTFDLDSLLDALVEQVLELTNAESGCAGLRNAEGMTCDRVRQGPTFVAFSYEGTPGSGWSGWVLSHVKPYLTNDALHDSVIVPELRRRLRVTSGMCIPILDTQKDVIGFFEVYNKQFGDEFTQQDLTNCLAAAQIASLAIQHSLTYRKLTALAAFSRSLTMVNDLEQIFETIGNHLEINFHRGSSILLKDDEGLRLAFRSADFVWTDEEQQAAKRCAESGQEAGLSTKVIADSRAFYLPLIVRGQVIGVLGLESRPAAWFSHVQRELLSGFIGQASLAIERGLIEQKLRRLRFLAESDRLQNALLTAVSHEVRAPIAAIMAAVSSLQNPNFPLDHARERQLLGTAEFEIKRLHRLMNNLLSVTRLEAGMARVKSEPCDLSDVIGAALEELGASTHKRTILLTISPDLPLVPMDFNLITQVLVNLLSNAFKFSPSDTPVELRSQIIGDDLDVMVIDQGIGVLERDLDRAFSKFQRLAEFRSTDGLGLGLSICKEFVEAHRGRISLEVNPDGGTIARFLLPVHPSPTFI